MTQKYIEASPAMQVDSNKKEEFRSTKLNSLQPQPDAPTTTKISLETIKFLEEKLDLHAKNNNRKSENRKRRTGSFFDDGCPDIALKSLFRKYDVDRNGTLSREELSVLFSEDLGLTDEQSEIYLYILDQNGDDCVSWDEFLFWMRSKERLQNVTDKVRYKMIRQALDLFQSYDNDHNFALDKEELKTVLLNSGGRVENIEVALQELDKDHNGNISFLEFLSWLNWIPSGDVFYEHAKDWPCRKKELLILFKSNLCSRKTVGCMVRLPQFQPQSKMEMVKKFTTIKYKREKLVTQCRYYYWNYYDNSMKFSPFFKGEECGTLL